MGLLPHRPSAPSPAAEPPPPPLEEDWSAGRAGAGAGARRLRPAAGRAGEVPGRGRGRAPERLRPGLGVEDEAPVVGAVQSEALHVGDALDVQHHRLGPQLPLHQADGGPPLEQPDSRSQGSPRGEPREGLQGETRSGIPRRWGRQPRPAGPGRGCRPPPASVRLRRRRRGGASPPGAPRRRRRGARRRPARGRGGPGRRPAKGSGRGPQGRPGGSGPAAGGAGATQLAGSSSPGPIQHHTSHPHGASQGCPGYTGRFPQGASTECGAYIKTVAGARSSAAPGASAVWRGRGRREGSGGGEGEEALRILHRQPAHGGLVRPGGAPGGEEVREQVGVAPFGLA